MKILELLGFTIFYVKIGKRVLINYKKEYLL